jgi:hypothetical protein
MDEQTQPAVSTSSESSDRWSDTGPIPEDWGGDGSGRMNLSGRRTAISPEHMPRHYQYFDTCVLPAQDWHINGLPASIQPATRQLLTWHDCGALTAKVMLPSQFTMPAGRFTADLEIFVLSGAIQLGEWKLQKHSYSFIPAGVRVGPWTVLEAATVLWMENGPVPLHYQNAQKDHPDARLGEFIPVLDSRLLPWGRADTTQFVTASKKWLRKTASGGVWLLAILPHYDGRHAMIQSYNEEAYGLVEYCDIGDYRFARDHFGYTPSFSTVPRHRAENGSLFFVRIDRDLSAAGTVLSYED